MALPSSGAISLSQVNVELGRSSTAAISLNESAVRTLFGRASGAISMSDGYGKANQFNLTISSNQTNANLRTLAVNAGWNQTSKVVATINSGVYVSSNSTGTPGLTISGSFPNGLEVTNNGFIIGRGGNGGDGNGNAGAAGGLALSVSSAVSIRNNGTIGGGGGGGGGGQSRREADAYGGSIVSGGGGGGGGRTGATNSAGGAAGPGNFGTSQPGGAGTASSAGGGGAGAPGAGAGGSGGGWGSSGSLGGAANSFASGPRGPGGAAGAAVNGNGNITWLATGTRLGAIS